ncbi:putative ribosomally synthesized peptide with SipW-like signal peptide [Nocardioides sp. J9]|uniref:hypothetical protein n=1 Tax=Nocardioides sp. J9 TaxID=935844 RepID=UPI00119D0254|nr:hypothetical protein [Nocardioides sp. J9]TWG97264.1 putative ribosomally synthesized peptide with SipW-like signal peptide [Nocardioides sp. J9]
MTTHMPRHHRRPARFGRGRTRALLSLGALLGVGAVATSAYWTAGSTVDGVTVESGAIHIDLATNDKVKPETYTWSDLSSSLPVTGGSTARVIRVSNNSTGRLTFSYTVSATATGALGSALKITVLRGGSVSGSTCNGGTAVGPSGAALNGFSASPGTLDATSAAAHHDLCVQVTLPTGSGAGGGQTSDVTFAFDATQVIS